MDRRELEQRLAIDWEGISDQPPETSGHGLLQLLMELGIFSTIRLIVGFSCSAIWCCVVLPERKAVFSWHRTRNPTIKRIVEFFIDGLMAASTARSVPQGFRTQAKGRRETAVLRSRMYVLESVERHIRREGSSVLLCMVLVLPGLQGDVPGGRRQARRWRQRRPAGKKRREWNTTRQPVRENSGEEE